MAALSPRPFRQIANPDEVGVYRRVWCRFYDRCLTTCCNESWLGFTCNFCAVAQVVLKADRLKDHFAQTGFPTEETN